MKSLQFAAMSWRSRQTKMQGFIPRRGILDLLCAGFAVGALVLAAAVQADAKPIKIIVPSTPGGGADVVARLLADQISKTQNVTMIVENKPGGGNVIGIEAVARAEPDGATVLISTPEFVINPHLRNQNYDPLKGFEQVCYLARAPQVIVVNAASPHHSFQEYLDDARKNPGKLNLASTSPSSSPYIAFDALKRAGNIDILYVPFQGSAPAISALLGNHVTSAFVSYPNVLAQIQAGQLRALAVTSARRIDDLPAIPTVAESGFPGFEAELWFGAAVPVATPPEAVAQLSAWFKSALDVPEIKAKLKAVGLSAVGTCGADFTRFIKDEFEKYGRQIQEAGISEK